MKVILGFGQEGLEIEVKDKNILDIVESRKSAPIKDVKQVVRESLLNPIGSLPLRDKIRGKNNICIVISDSTRAVPTKLLLEVLLPELESYGIKKDEITILIATGLHRPNLDEELERLVGKETVKNYRIVNHYAKDKETNEFIGKTKRGTPVIIDKTYLKSDFRILTGLIEPHFMAGFSGGRKAICPGISYKDMFKLFHGPEILESPFATNLVLENNPFHLEATEIAKMAGVDFIVNVTIDKNKEVTAVFSGDMEAAFYEGASFCRDHSAYKIKGEADIVITSGGGFPLDATFYQTVKGMVSAMPALKQGGIMIAASECNEEFGSEEFTNMMSSESDLDAFMEKINNPDFFILDQWQLEELVKARRKAELYLYSPCLLASRNQVPEATLKIVGSIQAGIDLGLKKFGPDAKITVIPEGPYVIPVI